MGDGMNNDDKKQLEAVEAVCRLAALNFPGDTDVRVNTTEGKHYGSVRVSCYQLLEAVKAKLYA